jgi:hypothetical protein
LSPTGPVAGRFPDASHHHVSDALRDTTGTIFGVSIAPDRYCMARPGAPICAEHTEALTLAQYHSVRCLVDE